MKLLSTLLENIKRTKGAVDKPIKGLYDAKVGDIIKIGAAGSRHKWTTRIAKIVTNDRLQDTEGNIFGRDGHIYRRKGWQLVDTKGQIVFAQHVTQKELDDDHQKDKIEYLKTYRRWEELGPEKIDEILKIINIGFSTMQGTKYYIKDKQ